MLNHEWIDELYRRAKTDEWYRSWAQAVRQSEPAFRAIRDSLPEAQQEQLDDYIANCEAQEDALFLIAYELGREHGKIIVVPPAEG